MPDVRAAEKFAESGRFAFHTTYERLLTEGIETHPVERVSVKVFGVAKTIATDRPSQERSPWPFGPIPRH
jgi:hypothetical protein